MSVIDEVVEANEIYSRTHELRRLTARPARKRAILKCLDTRLSIRTLGLMTGDAHTIRNAGGIVTDDSLPRCLYLTTCWTRKKSWSLTTPIAA